MKRIILITLTLTFGLTLVACTGRVPSEAKTISMSKRYFQKYGKKYKDPIFDQKTVESVEVKGVQELQKDVATGLVNVKTSDGSQNEAILTMIRKFPTGWRIKSWEKTN